MYASNTPQTTPQPAGHPVLILGAGRGGSALLELFANDPLVKVIGIADVIAGAPGLALAARYGIPAYTDVPAALAAARAYPDCVVFNLTHDDELAPLAEQALGQRNVTSGVAAHLVWRMVTHLKQVKAALEESQQQLSHMALHDNLTGLPNRAQFHARLEQSLAIAARNGQRLAVLFLDLDGFKPVNDTLGHEAGDQLLREVARRLHATLRDEDAVARVGGDEFNFILNHLPDAGTAARVADKVLQALAPAIALSGRDCRIGGSIGIALYPDHGKDAETLLRHADAAMYEAKRGGKNRYVFHHAPDAGAGDGKPV